MIAHVASTLLETYQKKVSSYDEVWDANGQIKPFWKILFESLEKLGIENVELRNQELIQKLRENGVTYNVYEGLDGMYRPWKLDPIPFLIEQTEWRTIEKGLGQRAKLLDMMYRDIYGPQKLLKSGILPPELIFDNTGFFRPCVDVKLPSEQQLILFAADLARGPDGRMWLLDNRSQVPSGSGYALENRSVMSKILPELTDGMYVSRLSPFFNHIQHTVARLSPRHENPNIVFLTPGPSNETYFEHAYLASYLGYTLVQGDDLLVRDGIVYLKSIDRLERVDVIIRRVDDEWCDPLELREDSRLGIPGLLQAMRLGNVSVINPPGSSILENNAIMAFIDNACRFLLGEDLMMPSIATWWCGQANELNYVLDNIQRLIIKKTNRKQRFRSVFGRLLSKSEIEDLKRQIKAAPHEFVAQEEVSLSTTPSYVDGKLEPRLAAMRTYLVGDGTQYQVLQGGLTRSSAVKDRFVISNQYGGISKDTWVVSDTMTATADKITIPQTASVHYVASLPSRSAENLFWVGRYCERTMAITKHLMITIEALQEKVDFKGSFRTEHIEILLKSLTHLTLTYPGFTDEKDTSALKNPYPEIYELVYNAKKLGTVHANLQAFLRGTISVSDRWNHDTWRIINQMENKQKRLSETSPKNVVETQKQLETLYSQLLTFYGNLFETMNRDNGFYLLEAGKAIERILSRISLIRSAFSFKSDLNVENELIEDILLNHHMLVQYRQLYKSSLSLETMLDMVLLEKNLPHSLSYQLDALLGYLEKLPKTGEFDRLNQAQKAVLEASTAVQLADIEALVIAQKDTHYRETLDSLLERVSSLILSVTVSLTNLYFSHTEIRHSLVASNTTLHEL
ncbi:MAG: circularly permuted type 2 ATP-grasp protein [Spirosomataceae bacterium]